VVNFDGEPRLIGQFVEVLISEALPNSLRGRIVTRDSVAAAGACCA
jgi:tRNA-2-methylthio-N6-dimethylallyladenosine synthase